MLCVICNKDLSEQPSSLARSKGLRKLIQCSLMREDNLSKIFNDVETIPLHIKCYARYTNERIDKNGQIKLLCLSKPLKIEQVSVVEGTPTDFLPEPETFDPEENIVVKTEADDCSKIELRDTVSEEDDPSKPFPFEHKCFFCAKDCDKQKEMRKPAAQRLIFSEITHESTQSKIIENLMKVPTPENERVLRRLEGVDLLAMGAKYHRKCFTLVYIKKPKTATQTPVQDQSIIDQPEAQATEFEQEDHIRITRTKSKQLADSFDYEMEDYRCHEEEEDSKSISYCHICLSSDRKLDILGEYEDVFNKICTDIIPSNEDSKLNLCLVCWECKALLRNVQRFRQRVRSAQQSLQTCATEKGPVKSLTTLCTYFPTDSICMEHEEHEDPQYKIEVANEPTIERNVTEEKKLQERNNFLENRVKSNEFDFGFDDFDDDDDDDVPDEKINGEKNRNDDNDSEDIQYDDDDKNDEDFVIGKRKRKKLDSARWRVAIEE